MGESLGLDEGWWDIITLHDGRTLEVHGPARCALKNCCIHKPSDHPLKDAPLTWLQDIAMMFRVCKHENIHPDPDAMNFHMTLQFLGQAKFYDGWHPCCPERCCQGRRPEQ